jgi:protein-tyrosine phosphatase
MIPLDLSRFGRRSGWLYHHGWSLADRLGYFAGLRGVEWRQVRRLVFVCRGNICRSAYAEHRARSMGLNATSFGVQAGPGREADPMAIAVASKRGIDLRAHRARSLLGFAAQIGDLLIPMEPSQLKPLRAFVRAWQVQLTLLGIWCSPPRPYLQDPYGLAAAYFDHCFATIDEAVNTMRQRMAATPVVGGRRRAALR